jgi:predicted extracellular nuclease
MQPQLLRMNADILCLQEINAQGNAGNMQLKDLTKLVNNTVYAGYNQAYAKKKNSNEPYQERNLVVLSKYPITSAEHIYDEDSSQPLYKTVTSAPPDLVAKKVEWERPIFHVTIDLGNGKVLHLIVVHLKSKIPTNITGQKINNYTWKSAAACAEGQFISAMKRVAQACNVRMLIDKIFDDAKNNNKPVPLIAVCGDFNSDIDDVPVVAIRGQVEETGNPALSLQVMIPCELSVPEDSRYSLLNLGKGEMLDHIIVSRELFQYYRHTEVHNEILPDESGAFRTDVKFPESDHAPVVAEFLLP